MTIISIDINGLKELQMAFDDLPDEAIDDVRAAAVAGAEIVLGRARANIHDRTGNLGRSLKITKPGRSKRSKYKIVAKVGFTKAGSYGVPLELGHGIVLVDKSGKRHGVGVVKEHPFLRPAGDASKGEVEALVAAAVDKALSGMGGKK